MTPEWQPRRQSTLLSSGRLVSVGSSSFVFLNCKSTSAAIAAFGVELVLVHGHRRRLGRPARPSRPSPPAERPSVSRTCGTHESSHIMSGTLNSTVGAPSTLNATGVNTPSAPRQSSPLRQLSAPLTPTAATPCRQAAQSRQRQAFHHLSPISHSRQLRFAVKHSRRLQLTAPTFSCSVNLHQLALLRHLANLLRDLHRAVLRPAHAAEVGALERVRRQRLVVIRAEPSRGSSDSSNCWFQSNSNRAFDSASSRSRAPLRLRAMSAAWAAILYAIIPCFTSSLLGQARGAPSASRSTASPRRPNRRAPRRCSS